MARGSLPINVAMIQVSPPDAFGYVSLGVSVDIVPAAVAAAKWVIAEVNPAMPRTQGDTTLHVRDIDALVPVDTPIIEYVHVPVTEQVVQQIARYIAGIIDDGSTLQIGLGRIPNEALRYLADRRDLGIHSDVITDAILPLLQNGRLTGREKSQSSGKIVASFALGTHELYDAIDGNALFALSPNFMGRRRRGHCRTTQDGLYQPGVFHRPHRTGMRRPVRRAVVRRAWARKSNSFAAPHVQKGANRSSA